MSRAGRRVGTTGDLTAFERGGVAASAAAACAEAACAVDAESTTSKAVADGPPPRGLVPEAVGVASASSRAGRGFPSFLAVCEREVRPTASSTRSSKMWTIRSPATGMASAKIPTRMMFVEPSTSR